MILPRFSLCRPSYCSITYFHIFINNLFFQICRVEDIGIAGLVQGTVIHFHRARTVVVHSTGTISASALGKLMHLSVLLTLIFIYHIYFYHIVGRPCNLASHSLFGRIEINGIYFLIPSSKT